jgi:hypothetical protein
MSMPTYLALLALFVMPLASHGDGPPDQALPMPAYLAPPANPAAVPHRPAQPWVCPAKVDAAGPSAENRAAEFLSYLKDVATDAIDALGSLFSGDADSRANRYSSDPNERMRQVLRESEDLRQIRREWNRFWLTNQPSCLTYDQLKDAIGP